MMYCVRDVHMFSGPVQASHLIKRHYGDGTFHFFPVCANCLPILVKDANKAGVVVDAEELKDEGLA